MKFIEVEILKGPTFNRTLKFAKEASYHEYRPDNKT